MRFHKGKFLLSVLTLMISQQAAAAYYQQFYQNAIGLGTANSESAVLEHAAGQCANPAGLVQLYSRRFVATGFYGYVNAQFKGTHTYTLPSTQTISYSGKSSTSVNGIFPKFYYGAPLNANWAYGISMTSPFMGELEYSDAGISRYSG